MSTPHPLFAENLRRHRELAGLTQMQLAHASDLHPDEVGKLERQERTPRLDTIVALSRALGMASVGELVEGVG
jgi:transcriptional regulator with XRE-family HTH domain